MPITLPGQLKNQQPAPTTSTSPLVQQKTGWTNDKGNGVAYGLNDLLEDITTPIEAEIDPSKTHGMDHYFNVFIQDFSNKIKNPSSFVKEKTIWMNDWNAAFQKNPTINLSVKISDFIKNNIALKLNDFFQASDGSEEPKIQVDFTKFMNNLVKNTQDFIDNKNFVDMDKETTSILKTMHLNKNDLGINNFLSLKNLAFAHLNATFENRRRSQANRPYKGWNKATANNALKDSFQSFLHHQSIADELSNAALLKANNQLQEIASKISGAPQIDSRTFEVIQELFKNKRTIPKELYKKFFGNEEQEFLDWENDWRGLFSFDPLIDVSKTDPTQAIFSMHVHTESVLVIPRYAAYLGLYTNPKQESKWDLDMPVENVVISESPYSTELLKTEYIDLAKLISTPLGQSQYDNWALNLKGKLQGNTFVGVTARELAVLDSNVFGALNSRIDSIKQIVDKLYKGSTSDLDITFDIVVNGDTLTLKPTIEDKAILTLPTVDWKGTSSSISDQKYVESLFRAMDQKHEKITPSPETTFDEQIMSTLEKITKELYSAFEQTGIQKMLPFRYELLSDKVGSPISMDDLKELLNSNAYNTIVGIWNKYINKDLGNPNHGFLVDFSIEQINDDGMVLAYTVTDKSTGRVSKYLGDYSGHKSTGKQTPLDNIKLEFDHGTNKAEDILSVLDKSRKVSIDYKRIKHQHLTTFQLDAIFPELDQIIKDAHKGDVKLKTIGDLTRGLGRNSDKFYQQFQASYKAWSGKNITQTLILEVPNADAVKRKGIFKHFIKPKHLTDHEDKIAQQITKRKPLPHEKIKGVHKQPQKPKPHTNHEEKIAQQITKRKPLPSEKIKGVHKQPQKPKHHPNHEDKKAQDITKKKPFKDDANNQKRKGVFKFSHPWNKPKHHKDHETKMAQWAREHFKQKDDDEIANIALAAAGAAALEAIENAGLGADGQEAVKEQIQKTIEGLKGQLDNPDLTPDERTKIQQAIDNLPEETKQDILDNIQGDLEKKLAKEFPDGVIPDEMRDALQKALQGVGNKITELGNFQVPGNLDAIKNLLEGAKHMDLSKLMNVKRLMNSSTKITLVALAGLLGVGSVLGAANAGKIASTNRRINAANGSQGKIKSSKKIAFMSMAFGMLSLFGSIGTFLYIFISQGGL